MGYNSVIFICNDAMDEIDKDPVGWWKKASEKIALLDTDDKNGIFGYGNHVNGYQAVWNDHADNVAVIIVGGNYATVVGSTITNGHHEEEQQNKILVKILKDRGYTSYRKKIYKRHLK